MKKIVMIAMLFCIVSCGSSSNSTNKQSSKSDISSLSVQDNSKSSTSSLSVQDNEVPKKFEDIVYNENGRENLLSQEQILNVNRVLTAPEKNMKRKMMNSSSDSVSISSETSTAIDNSISSSFSQNNSSELTGKINVYLPSPTFAFSMISGPCSKAFVTLQSLIFSGNGSYDFSNKTIGSVRITRFDEDKSLTLIRYDQSNVFICSDEENSYCFEINLRVDGSYSFNFMNTMASVSYWSQDRTFLEEFDMLVAELEKFDQYNVSSTPLVLYKKILEEEGHHDNWKKKIDLDLSSFVAPNKYMQNLDNLFYSRRYIMEGETDVLNVQDNTLEGITSLVNSFYLSIPDYITKVGKLSEKTMYNEVSAVYIPSSVIELDFNAFTGLGVELFFIDGYKENLTDEYINALKNSSPDARIYYKNNWESYNDILIPKEYYYSMYDNNIEGVNIKDKVLALNNILKFGTIIPVNEYNILLDEYNELIDKLTNEPTFLEEVDSNIYLFFDKVISKIDTDSLYYFYKLEDGQEVVVENITGEQFINENIEISIVNESNRVDLITIYFDTDVWPSVQLSEIFGENVIPEISNDEITFLSIYSDYSLVRLTINNPNIDKESVLNEYHNILLNSGYEFVNNEYWIRLDGKIVKIILDKYDGSILFYTSEKRLPVPTTGVSIISQSIIYKEWPSNEELAEVAPFYVDDLPKFYALNDPLFSITIQFGYNGISCFGRYSEPDVEKFILELEEKQYQAYFDEDSGEILYYYKEYESFTISISLQRNSSYLNVEYAII